MSPKKLSDTVKQEILQLYRETEQTTSTLAERYEVSSSTISRFLKTHLSPPEYDQLIQQKRLARVAKTDPETQAIEAPVEVILKQEILFPPTEITPLAEIPLDEDYEEEEEILESVQVNNSEYFYDDDDDDEDDEDDEDDDSDLSPSPLTTKINLQVLPLATASFPKTCYLVIDRSAELITRPLKDFAQLGKIPSEEFQQKTLPIFDNHKVAKRFSNRSQRVIKVPDARILQKTSNYLHAKGITRVLMDGQIYSLSST